MESSVSAGATCACGQRLDLLGRRRAGRPPRPVPGQGGVDCRMAGGRGSVAGTCRALVSYPAAGRLGRGLRPPPVTAGPPSRAAVFLASRLLRGRGRSGRRRLVARLAVALHGLRGGLPGRRLGVCFAGAARLRRLPPLGPRQLRLGRGAAAAPGRGPAGSARRPPQRWPGRPRRAPGPPRTAPAWPAPPGWPSWSPPVHRRGPAPARRWRRPCRRTPHPCRRAFTTFVAFFRDASVTPMASSRYARHASCIGAPPLVVHGLVHRRCSRYRPAAARRCGTVAARRQDYGVRDPREVRWPRVDQCRQALRDGVRPAGRRPGDGRAGSTSTAPSPATSAIWTSTSTAGCAAARSSTWPTATTRGAKIRLGVASDDLLALVAGELNFASAWASGRVSVKASFGDLLKLRKLL